MKRPKRYIPLIFATAALLLALIPRAMAAEQTPGTAKVKTLSLGIISRRSQEEVERQYRDFASYLARKLFSPSKAEGRVVAAPGVWQLAKLLEKKQADFYMDSPYPTYLINRQGAAILLLRRWKGGVAEYHSILFAKGAGGTTRLEDLWGKLIAFEDPGSTSGYFLPKVFLLEKGFKLAEKPGLEAAVAPKEVGYTFTYSTGNMVDLVLSNKVAAGAFSNEDYERLGEQKRAAISVLGQTENFPRHFLSTRKDLDPELAYRLEEILLFMDQDAEGRKILQKTDNTTKFDLLPGGANVVRRKLEALFGPH